ncbi:MAG: riboflavin synthase [Leptolyngbyaceae bacterium]|nr:riboflavin synthase [Leptolyngbyaceae bacterium]
MFTGLIQAIGKISQPSSTELYVSWDTQRYSRVGEGIAMGDSIAVDGVCLTVTRIMPDGFIADVSPETLSRTTLSQDHMGQCPVNLESSLRVGSKVGGHFVTGHIDGVGYLSAATRTATSWEMSFDVPDQRIARYIVPKGSIAINGVSLTVADCNGSGNWFKVAVIPVTYHDTNLQFLVPGSRVNLEGDVLGKYVEKFMRVSPSSVASNLMANGEDASPNANGAADGHGSDEWVTSEFLAEHGYS